MNKSDVEGLSYILSSSKTLDEARERILEMDSRLPKEYAGFLQVEEADERVTKLYEEEMEKRFGPNWAIKRDSRKASKEIWDECEKKVKGTWKDDGELWNADPDCEHELTHAPGGGVK